MPSNAAQPDAAPRPVDYKSQRFRRRRWPWIVVLVVLVAIGCAVGYFLLVESNSIHKRRERILQAGILNATPRTPHLVHEWNANAARGEQVYQNLMGGPIAYDQVDGKAIIFPILRAAMLDGAERRAVLVWLDAEWADGFDIEYAIIEPGGRYLLSRLLKSGTQTFSGAKSQQPIRVWSATFPGVDHSKFTFEFEIDGVRRMAEATLAGSNLTFTTVPVP